MAVKRRKRAKAVTATAGGARSLPLRAARAAAAPVARLAKAHPVLERALTDFLGTVPTSNEKKARDPIARGRRIGKAAAARAAIVSGGFALPTGPMGFMTLVPELLAIWRLQAQLVADIAGCFGKAAKLTPEHVMYCMFRHAASQAVRGIAVRVGTRIAIRQATPKLLRPALKLLSRRVTEQLVKRTSLRFIPIVGAVGVGAFAYYDTQRVAETAIELFRQERSR